MTAWKIPANAVQYRDTITLMQVDCVTPSGKSRILQTAEPEEKVVNNTEEKIAKQM